MRTTIPSTELKQASQRTARKGRLFGWGVYLTVAFSLLALWFVAGELLFSYLFGGWMMIGAILLWLIEDAAEY
jgi:hypothetical protein